MSSLNELTQLNLRSKSLVLRDVKSIFRMEEKEVSRLTHFRIKVVMITKSIVKIP